MLERRLTAILAADVVGYSRLMGANEVGTLRSLEGHQRELIEPEVAASRGRIVKLTGDGILAEFPSVVGAVECASAIQRGMRIRNRDIPDDRRIQLRIGINLGDVIVRDDDLFGDGVNIAARLEGVARPGGIAVSQSVRDHVGNKLDLLFRDKGDQLLKNIAEPVRVYDVVLEPGAPDPMSAEGPMMMSDKPSIAILPFTNMSGDPEQEYFSDGIAEDIITDLSKISNLFVVGRNTSFTYKGMFLQLPKVASELGVKFLLEGSVRKAGQKVRVTAQLIDGPSGGHLWADRYDRELTDIFVIQDEITKAIVDQLKVRLFPEEMEALGQAPTRNVEAYTYYLRGRQYFHNCTRWFLGLARQMFCQAIDLDPGYARAYAWLSLTQVRLASWFGVPSSMDEIVATACKAMELAPDLAEAHAALGEALNVVGRRPEAEAAFERALEIDPNNFEANLFYGRHWMSIGEYDRSLRYFMRATEVQPDDFQAPFLLEGSLRALGRADEGVPYVRMGVKRAEEALQKYPESSRPAQLGATALAAIGEVDQARRWIERALAIDPDDPHIKYNAACVYAQLGEVDKAFDFLEQWATHSGVENRDWMLHDPDLDALRENPRHQHIIDIIEARIGSRAPATASASPQPS
ncbi:adenylate/guanylate cyclase domain-containing protein [Sphingomonas sp. RB56-2]|uniref:Adenylate/guanylate cyclase domain-containing protein n=1 Tax=Sphingomonas brevis TaxID=2908206 RepID=A0ABT0SAA1_9SPHN|nr:adenylate/guanylate cyclase domain-containing protein [Sphingomonas brevis]MCL6741331.1 adenylate/guanylate cyclase domain-containing protein [Sphingomonas brevis]